MNFVSLNTVLQAIGACITVPESARLDPDEPAWMHKINDSYCRYSAAAALLDHHLVASPQPLAPRWLDMREGTGYPRPSDAAGGDGTKFLLDQAKWYPRWLKFNQEFRRRRLFPVDKCTAPASLEDYARNCPQSPAVARANEIGFDAKELGDFLDRLAIPHAREREPLPEPGPAAMSLAEDAATGVPAEAKDDIAPEISSSAQGATPTIPATPRSTVHKTGKPGRRSAIEKALRHAYASAGEQRHDIDAVFSQLKELAVKCPEKFDPLHGYENGRILYWRNGRKTEYTRKAMAAYVGRRIEEERQG